MEEPEVEKTIVLSTGRIVRMTAKKMESLNYLHPGLELDVTIKEAREDNFHPPIETKHPKYWKFRTMDSDRQLLLKIQYSGLNKRQTKQAIQELQQKLLN